LHAEEVPFVAADKQRRNSKAERLAPYRWKPGESGNPAGRPKRAALSELYREKLDAVVPNDKHGRTYGQKIVDAIFAKALTGQISAAEEIGNRVEGRPGTSVALSGPNGAPLIASSEELNAEVLTMLGNLVRKDDGFRSKVKQLIGEAEAGNVTA
jgi:hypothetical protein